MKPLSLLILLSACGPVGVCQTPCGLDFLSLGASWTCEGVQAAEKIVLQEFARSTDERLECASLRGYQVEVQPARGLVGGQTRCDEHRLWVSDKNLIQESIAASLAHELAHAAQRCDRSMGVDVGGPRAGDVDHANWERDGIDAAILRVWRPRAR